MLPLAASWALPWLVAEALATTEHLRLVWLGSAGVSLAVVAVPVLGERRRLGRFSHRTLVLLAIAAGLGYVWLRVDWQGWFPGVGFVLCVLHAVLGTMWVCRPRQGAH